MEPVEKFANVASLAFPDAPRAASMIAGFNPNRCAILIPAEAPGHSHLQFVGRL